MRTRRLALLAVLAAAVIGLVLLGNWQLARREWKLALIERVERHLAAPPVPAPGPAEWPAISRDDAYRRLRAEGVFVHGQETCTKAVTERGAGCWVITPLQMADGNLLLVNRGFVDDAHRDPATRAAGQVAGTVTVTGLLRLSEPGGGFLRRNDPAGNRWYSRDVAAIAAARGLPVDRVAPYFIDADAQASVADGPVGGLTVIRFANSHLVYALTWYGLALMVLAAIGILLRTTASKSDING
jgi:surfeit locus 1 family protein